MNLLTVYIGVYLNDINGLNGKMFKVNHQYLYSGMVTLAGVCCGTLEAFVVPCNGTTYYIPSTRAVATTVVIPKKDQSFSHKFYDVFLQNQEHHDFSFINNNCKNCNGQIPHGDYSNNVHTGGYKDPDLVFKEDHDE